MNLSKAIKKNWDENKGTYITAGVLIGVGMVVGMKYQKKLDIDALTKNIKKGKALIPNMGDLMVPELALKSLDELKTLALEDGGVIVQNALIATVDGIPMLFVR